MFSDRRLSFNGLKHLTEKVTAVTSLTRVWVVVDHTVTTALQISTELYLALIFDQCFTPSRLHLLSKTS